MSKKNKAKFKRHNLVSANKNQVLNQITQQNSVSTTPATTPKSIDNAAIKNPQKSNLEMQDMAQIKGDLAKTGIIVAVLILCILGLYFADLKYHILTTFGSWLFKVLNIG